MKFNGVPVDLRVEALMNHLPKERWKTVIVGPHKRNAYEDIIDISDEDTGSLLFTVGRKGLYDVLPEALFHPVDRYDNIPANEYDERFKEEFRLQEEEEEKARKFFALFDEFLLRLSSVCSLVKDLTDEKSFIADIIGDSVSDEMKGNRFVRKMWRFLPTVRTLRGDRSMLSLVIRQVLSDEGIVLEPATRTIRTVDARPRYACGLTLTENEEETYLGNEFCENADIFRVRYWSEEDCDGEFLNFVKELREFEDFLNDWFVGIGNRLDFDLVTMTDAVRLDDDDVINYLDYNTNL